jgi:hypothetical protein
VQSLAQHYPVHSSRYTTRSGLGSGLRVAEWEGNEDGEDSGVSVRLAMGSLVSVWFVVQL